MAEIMELARQRGNIQGLDRAARRQRAGLLARGLLMLRPDVDENLRAVSRALVEGGHRDIREHVAEFGEDAR